MSPSDNERSFSHRILFGIILISILSITCCCIENAGAEPVFSVTATDEPLYEVLAKISKATGYRIEMSKNLENEVVTGNLKHVSLTEGIEEVIRLTGMLNYIIIKNDNLKKIEIIIPDAFAGFPTNGTKNVMEDRNKKTGRIPSPGGDLKGQIDLRGAGAGPEPEPPIDEDIARPDIDNEALGRGFIPPD